MITKLSAGGRAKIRVLLTGVGAPGTSGSIFMLREGARDDGVDLEIFGVDALESAALPAGVKFCGTLPDPESPDYFRALNDVVAEFEINLIVPQTTRENYAIAISPGKVNCPTLTLSARSMVALNDKSNVMAGFHEAGILTTQYELTESQSELTEAMRKFGHPEKDVVVKLPASSGMRGTRKITKTAISINEFLEQKPNEWSATEDQLLTILQSAEKWPPLIVMPFYSGPEFSVDVLSLDDHRVIIPRRRDKTRSGISTETSIDFDPRILDELNRFLDYHEVFGLMGFQFIMSDGAPRILESNPRVQGTMVASMVTGVNLLWLAAKRELGLNTRAAEFTIKETSGRFIRLWGGYLINENGSSRYI